jgi:DNA-binding transcriptional regulator YdaS (Cro superfamily)
MMNPIERLRAAGYGPARLARLLANISPQAISQWSKVPEDRVVEVERVTGISRHELRPDLSEIFGTDPDPSTHAAEVSA